MLFAKEISNYIIPLPGDIKNNNGTYEIINGSVVSYDKELKNEAIYLVDRFAQGAGLTLKPVEKFGNSEIILEFDKTLSNQEYKISITPSGVKIRGGNAQAIFYGIQTFLQMLPSEIYGNEPADDKYWIVDCVEVCDKPVFTWRGMALDSVSHYQSKEWIKKFIDTLSIYKINYFHWQLVGRNSWRLGLQKYPQFIEIQREYPNAYNSEIKSETIFYEKDKWHGGGIYTEEDIKEILEYAKLRHIAIIPGVDFLSSSKSLSVVFPKFFENKECIFLPTSEAISIQQDILKEILSLFKDSPAICLTDYDVEDLFELKSKVYFDFAKNQNFNSINELKLSHFNKLAEVVFKEKREILLSNKYLFLRKGNENRIKGISRIWDKNTSENSILSLSDVTDFDSSQGVMKFSNRKNLRKIIPLKRVYSFDKKDKKTLSAQAWVDTTSMLKEKDIEFHVFPRLIVLSENLWRGKLEEDQYQIFLKRLGKHQKRWEVLKLNYHPVEPSILNGWNNALLKNELGYFDIELPLDIFSSEQGDAVVEFLYQRGAERLIIKKVELRQDNRLLAEDKHDGFAGFEHINHFYRLKYKGLSLVKPYVLRVYHENGKLWQSEGVIKVYVGKNFDAFDEPLPKH